MPNSPLCGEFCTVYTAFPLGSRYRKVIDRCNAAGPTTSTMCLPSEIEQSPEGLGYMRVKKCSGRFSPADILERVFDGGIVIDATDRLSVTPEPPLLEDKKVLRAEPGTSCLKTRALWQQINAQRQALKSRVATARKTRLAAARTLLQTVIAHCAFVHAHRHATSRY